MNIGLGGGIVSTYDVISSSASKEELDQAENTCTTGLDKLGHVGDQN